MNNLIQSVEKIAKKATKQTPPTGSFTYYQQKGIRDSLNRNRPTAEREVEMKEMDGDTVEVDLDELRNRNMMEGKQVEMPTEVPEDSGALGEDGFLSPEQDGRLPDQTQRTM
jgi:hypothetical protein